MSVEGVYFITFRSVTYAQRAERLLSRAGFIERLPPAMRVRRKKFNLCVEKKNLQ